MNKIINNTTTNHTFSEQHSWLIIWTLLSVAPVLGMAIDLVSPSLPSIAQHLHITNSYAKNVISLYLLGYALGNFSGGLLTDSLGRRKLILIGLVGFVSASLLPVFYPEINVLLLARFFQGLMIGCVAVVSRAVFADILSADKLVKLGVLGGTMFGIGPIIGPFIGGYLQYYFGWQSCFIFFASLVFIEFIAIFFIVPETHFKRQAFDLKTIQNNLIEVFSHREFIAMVLMMGSVYSMIIAFNIIGPFLIQTQFHYSPVFFGYMALSMGVAFLTATLVCRHLLTQHTVKRLFFIFINTTFIVALCAVAISYFFQTSIIWLIIVSAYMFFAAGFIFPMSMGNGLSFFRHIAGTASATMYLVNILITSLTGFVLSFFTVSTIIPLLLVYLVFMSLCLWIYSTMVCPCRIWKKKPVTN